MQIKDGHNNEASSANLQDSTTESDMFSEAQMSSGVEILLSTVPGTTYPSIEPSKYCGVEEQRMALRSAAARNLSDRFADRSAVAGALGFACTADYLPPEVIPDVYESLATISLAGATFVGLCMCDSADPAEIMDGILCLSSFNQSAAAWAAKQLLSNSEAASQVQALSLGILSEIDLSSAKVIAETIKAATPQMIATIEEIRKLPPTSQEALDLEDFSLSPIHAVFSHYHAMKDHPQIVEHMLDNETVLSDTYLNASIMGVLLRSPSSTTVGAAFSNLERMDPIVASQLSEVLQLSF